MDETEPMDHGPVFRSSKRRKVFRKRADSGGGDAETGRPQAASTTSGNEEDEFESSAPLESAARVRRMKNRGIEFTASDGKPQRPQEESDEAASVTAKRQVPEAVQRQNERFTKPTGKAVVVDDKHMYVHDDDSWSCRTHITSRGNANGVGRHS